MLYQKLFANCLLLIKHSIHIIRKMINREYKLCIKMSVYRRVYTEINFLVILIAFFLHMPLLIIYLHLPHANHKFCEVNAKYQLHKLLRAISHPLCAKETVSRIREEDTAMEVMILNMSPHQFSMFVKMAFVNSYRVDCNCVNCINNCKR